MADPAAEPWIPAYTVQRRKLTAKERGKEARRRAGKAATTSGALSAAATAALTRGKVRPSVEAGAAGAVLGGVLGAASAPRHRYEMRRIHGLSARPTAPGERPKVFLRETYKEADDIGKAATAEQKQRRRSAATLAAGSSAVLAATNASRLEQGVRTVGEWGRTDALNRLDRVYGVNRAGLPVLNDPRPPAGQRTPKQKQQAKRMVRRKHGTINQVNRIANATQRGMPNRVKVPLMVAGFTGGGLAAWKGARDLAQPVGKALTRDDVDRGFAAGAAGAGGYQAAMYGTKLYDRKIERKWRTLDREAESAGKGQAGPSKIMADHRKKVGLPSNARLGDPRWLKYWRTTPKEVPGWKFKRTMSRVHGGKTGVALTTGTGAVAAGAAIAAGRRNDRVGKRGPTSDDTPSLGSLAYSSSGATNRAHVEAVRAWRAKEQAGGVTGSARAKVRARRVWRKKNISLEAQAAARASQDTGQVRQRQASSNHAELRRLMGSAQPGDRAKAEDLIGRMQRGEVAKNAFGVVHPA